MSNQIRFSKGEGTRILAEIDIDLQQHDVIIDVEDAVKCVSDRSDIGYSLMDGYLAVGDVTCFDVVFAHHEFRESLVQAVEDVYEERVLQIQAVLDELMNNPPEHHHG